MSASVGMCRNSLPVWLYSPPPENRFPEHNKLSREKGEEMFALVSQLQTDDGESEFDSRPALRRVNEQVKLTLDAQILLLLREADQNNERFLEKKLINRLGLMNAQLEARKKELLALADDIQKVTAESETLLEQLKEAYGGVGEKQQALYAAKEQLSALEKRLAELDKQGIAQDDPRYTALQKEIAAAKGGVVSACAALAGAQQTLLQLEQQALDRINQRDQLVDKVAGLIYVSGQQVMDRAVLLAAQEKGVALRDLINELLLKMIEQFSASSLAKLKHDQAVNKARREATQASMMEQANKAAEQERKAQEASQKANCVAKILGGVLTALGALTTVFGGAGTALMMIGVGMLVMDAVSQALFGFSLSEKLMSPLMEHIFMPLMEQIGKLVDAILSQPPFSTLLTALDKAAGTSVSAMIKTAVAAAVTIAVIVAAALLLKSAGKALYNKLGKTITLAVEKQVTQAIQTAVKHLPSQLKRLGSAAKRLITQLQKELDNLLSKLPVSRQSVANKLSSLADGAALTKIGAEQTYAIIGASYNVQAAENKSALAVNRKVMTLLSENIERMLKVMEHSDALKNDFIEQVSQLLDAHYKTATFIAKQKLSRM